MSFYNHITSFMAYSLRVLASYQQYLGEPRIVRTPRSGPPVGASRKLAADGNGRFAQPAVIGEQCVREKVMILTPAEPFPGRLISICDVESTSFY